MPTIGRLSFRMDLERLQRCFKLKTIHQVVDRKELFLRVGQHTPLVLHEATISEHVSNHSLTIGKKRAQHVAADAGKQFHTISASSRELEVKEAPDTANRSFLRTPDGGFTADAQQVKGFVWLFAIIITRSRYCRSLLCRISAACHLGLMPVGGTSGQFPYDRLIR